MSLLDVVVVIVDNFDVELILTFNDVDSVDSVIEIDDEFIMGWVVVVVVVVDI